MSEPVSNTRLEAFSDGVFAIAITLLVIDIKIPSSIEFHSNADLWLALRKIIPAIGAFLLSFGVILITWVNHHNFLKLVNRSSGSFLYANGFLLLTVAFIPFPTSLMGEFLFTNHATPAVVVYEFVLTLQAVGWILISNTAITNHLGKSETAKAEIQKNGRFGYFAFILYGLFAILSLWIPHIISLITTLTWIFWLIFGIRIKHEEI